MSKNVIFENGVKKMFEGVEILANAVMGTLGPGGRNVIYEKKGLTPSVTKDGVTVAKEIFLKDPVQNMGAQLVKEVALRVGDEAGDGTTTATLLAYAIIKEGLQAMGSGENPILIKRGIDAAVEKVVQDIKSHSIIVNEEDILKVATISANGDEEIGSIVASAFKLVGKDGIINIEDSNDTKTKLKHNKGIYFDRGWSHPHFVNRATGEAVLEKVHILLYDKKLSLVNDVINILRPIANKGEGLLIIAEEVDGELMGTIISNKVKAGLNWCVVRKPSYGDNQIEIMEDIAAMVGTKFISSAKGDDIRTVNVSDLGWAEKVIVTRDNTIITGNRADESRVQMRIEQIRNELSNASDYLTKIQLQERLARMTNGIAVIQIGAASETEISEKKDRAEDAKQATKAAILEGIVPGGGIALFRAIQQLNNIQCKTKSESIGVEIVKNALIWPLKKIIENAGYDVDSKIDLIKNQSYEFGFDARTGKCDNLITLGVIDPVKVVRTALESAASVAGLFLTAHCIIHDNNDEQELKMLGTIPIN